MTTAVTLTTSWQEIAGTGTKLASFETDGEVFMSIQNTEPTGEGYKTCRNNDSIFLRCKEKVWAKKENDAGNSYAKISTLTDLADTPVLSAAAAIRL